MTGRFRLLACLLIGVAVGVFATMAVFSNEAADPEDNALVAAPTATEEAAPTPDDNPAVAAARCDPATMVRAPGTLIDGMFVADFDVAPDTPRGLCGGADWDIQVHSRDHGTWFELESMDAHHGHDCSGPPNTHGLNSYENAVFVCRNHLMTALNTSGYGVIYLTPNHIFQFGEEGTLTFSLSTERMSTRDWWDILITPVDENLALPLLSDLSESVDLQGFANNTISIATDNGEGSPILKIARDGIVQSYQTGSQVLPAHAGIDETVNQAATRQTFRLTIDDGSLKFERLASETADALVFWEVEAEVPFDAGIVQFGHHSYNPEKDGAGIPATWHWDAIQFGPAEPFTIIPADRRFTEGGEVAFDTPAPEGAYLRFSALCQVLVDGGLVSRQPSATRGKPYQAEHASSYFVPIAAGTRSVEITFQPDDWYSGPCIAKDISIWGFSA